jgi:uncharacterized protein YndB with AHSA1/START domain
VVPDRISREIVVDAPRNDVWAIVTDPRHVARCWNRELDELRDYVAQLGISYGSS